MEGTTLSFQLNFIENDQDVDNITYLSAQF